MNGFESTTPSIRSVELWILDGDRQWVEQLPLESYQTRLRELLEQGAVISWINRRD